MEFRISRDSFLRGIQVIQNVAQPSLSTPILENVLLQSEGENQIKLRASNLTLNVVCFMSGVVLEEGMIALPTKEVGQIIRELPSAEMELKSEGGQVRIRCGTASLRLRGIEPEEFPPMMLIEEGKEVEIPVSDFCALVDKTAFASSTQKARYVLEGIKIDIEGSRAKFIATDGKRLSLVERSIEKEVESPINVLVPARAMNEVRRILSQSSAVSIKASEKKMEFKGEDFLLSSNLLVDNFPPYRQLIPSEFNIALQVNTEEILQAVRRASILVDDRTRMAILSISENTLEVSGESQAHGEANTKLEIDYEGESFRTAFRVEFLLDVLRVIEGEKTRIEMKSPGSPAVVKDSSDAGFAHVLMPMKIEDEKEEEEGEYEE